MDGGTPTTYYFQRNLLGDVVGIYNANGVLVTEYAYDAYGNCTIKQGAGNTISKINPIRYRGYYLDRETNLYYLNSRYYNPEWRRFISPANVSAFNPKAVNGLNLYAYADNQPIVNFSDKTQFSNTASITAANTPTLLTNDYPRNYLNIHWGQKWMDTDWPSFLVFSNQKGALVDWGLSIYKGSLYFDIAENHSLYMGIGNVSAFIGYNVEKNKYGAFADVNVLSIGYDGIYIDAGVSVVGVGVILGWEGTKFRFKIDPPGWFGFELSIDFGQILKDIFGLEW